MIVLIFSLSLFISTCITFLSIFVFTKIIKKVDTAVFITLAILIVLLSFSFTANFI